MNQIECLEREIAALDPKSFTTLRDWIIALDQTRWDQQLEQDSNTGKLDLLINSMCRMRCAHQS